MSITVLMGPMFSGKTSELFRLAERHILSNERVIMFKYAQDTRYDKGRRGLASSHDQKTFRAHPVTNLADNKLVDQLCATADVVCLDEAQFLEGLTEFCNAQAGQGKRVIVAGLSGTFERKPWPRMAALLSSAEHVVQLSAICVMCHQDACFTRRLGASKVLEVIGAGPSDGSAVVPEEGAYVPCCRVCWTLPVEQHVLDRLGKNVEKMKSLQNK